MKRNTLIWNWLSVFCLTIIAYGLTEGAETSNKASTIRFESLPIYPGFNAARVDAVGKAIGFQNWPQTEVRRIGLVISKSLLSRPELITRESTSYSHVPFDQVPWGTFEWSCQCLVESNEPLPTELLPERKARLLEHLSSEKRNDPNFVEEYLKRKLDRYRKSKKYCLNGEMDVELCLGPSSRAAQEYMLVIMTENTMPTEGVVSMYTHAKRPKRLGTVSFLTESTKKDDIRVKFVRDNIFLNIRGNGCFADEVLPVAYKIDAMFIRQPALTYEQLLARRPSIKIAANAVKSTTADHFTAPYNVSAPEGANIVSVKAYVDGESTWFEDGRIVIRGKKGKVKVKLTATTSELLSNSFEREVIVPDEEQDSQP